VTSAEIDRLTSHASSLLLVNNQLDSEANTF
jgi:hypothetical protein